MKIATLTYQRHDNYGAMLQCYALQKRIQELGVETQVIDYICKVSEKPFSFEALKTKGVKRYITGCIGATTRLPRARKFKQFRKNYLKMTKTVTEKNISQIGAIYDGYIVGSDNVWNSDITGFDERYFLSFVADKRKRASYAASFGSTKITDSLKEQYKELLGNFAHITMREKTGAELVNDLTGIDAKVVCDPTMLLSKEEWSKIAVEPNIKEKYLLAYQMVPSRTFVKFVRALSEKKGLKVVYVPFPYGFLKCQTAMTIGPLEWLGLFKNAEFIVTDSFHGCVFSAIYQKEFVVRISQLGERIDNFLSILGIKDRVVESCEDALALTPIDYSAVETKMLAFRKDSETELRAIISYFENVKNQGENGIVDPSRCTGCLLCHKLCPKNAIEIKKDDLGFLYPVINYEKCIQCNLCERACSSLPLYKQNDTRECYAAINKDQNIVANSASGGVFPALASYILERGGIVFGAGYGECFSIEHLGIKREEEIPKLQGTKYPQSNILEVYEEIQEVLVEKKEVLFIGTSCQCSAIRKYLEFNKVSDEKLHIVDIFCNGVFSPTIWKEYISYLEDKFGKIDYVSFRDKKKGWRNKHLKIIACGKDISDYCNNHASILRMYEMKIGFRESCYQCPYMIMDRVGDVSIGDFWGIERIKPGFDRNTGVSAIIVNNHKGRKMIEEIKNEFDVIAVSDIEILQPVLRGFNTKHSRRTDFIKTYRYGGIMAILDKYGKVKGALKLKRDIIVPLLYKTRTAGMVSKILHMNDE